MNLFPQTQALEKFDFSNLHKAVLRILQTDLVVLLQNRTFSVEINHQDTWGRTPLHWAAKLGDAKAVEALIHAGAEVNIQDRTASTPTHYAASARHHRALELLLMAGANVRARNWRGHEPIHNAVARSPSHVKALLTANATLYPGSDNIFCLIKTPEVAHLLVSEGCDMELDDAEGNTALFFHIQFPYYRSVLGWLLAAGVNASHINKAGSTMLHWTARWGDTSLVNFLCNANLRSVDVNALDNKGRTAMQVLEERSDSPIGLLEAFTRLIACIQANQLGFDDVGDEFFDAAEKQEDLAESCKN